MEVRRKFVKEIFCSQPPDPGFVILNQTGEKTQHIQRQVAGHAVRHLEADRRNWKWKVAELEKLSAKYRVGKKQQQGDKLLRGEVSRLAVYVSLPCEQSEKMFVCVCVCQRTSDILSA